MPHASVFDHLSLYICGFIIWSKVFSYVEQKSASLQILALAFRLPSRAAYWETFLSLTTSVLNMRKDIPNTGSN